MGRASGQADDISKQSHVIGIFTGTSFLRLLPNIRLFFSNSMLFSCAKSVAIRLVKFS